MMQKKQAESAAEKTKAITKDELPEGAQSGTGADPSVPMTGQPTPVRTKDLMAQVVSKENMSSAYKRVVSNKGAAGVDGMEVDQLQPFLKANWERIKLQLEKGTYYPNPVRKVEIPKPGGGKRMLGIPTALDRLINQAILQVLTPIWEPLFSENSYGFRPGRSAQDAVKKVQSYQNEGLKIVVDLDLEKFFDEVNHARLMSKIMERTPGEWPLHRLIHRYLKAGMMEGGVTQSREKGTPQGSPLSPLLSNIVLDELDKELESRGHKFVRYADDCNVYVAKQRSGERVFASLTRFIENKMRLKVNKEKSKVDQPKHRKFLGFSFYNKQVGMGIRIAPSSIERLRKGIKALCGQGRGWNLKRFIQELLNPYLRGWINYYRIADAKKTLHRIDEWIRRRLRLILWRQWKRNWTRRNKLISAGLTEQRAVESAFNGRGPWWNSGASHMNQAFTKRYFQKLELISLQEKFLDYKKTVTNRTAVYGTVRTVVGEDR
jgi:RNA-directed DNA polymerase